MRYTLIPPDIVFIRSDGRIAHIHSGAVPGDEMPVHSAEPVLAALWVNGGGTNRTQLTIGNFAQYSLPFSMHVGAGRLATFKPGIAASCSAPD